MTIIKQAFNIFKIIFKDTFYKTLDKLGKKKKDENVNLTTKPSKKSSKIAVGILIAIGLIMILFYIVTFAAMFTRTCIANGIQEELLYVFIAAAQFVVVFFGSVALLNYLYFSKDNTLLASLPVTPKSIFIAKYAMTYVSEYILCLFISLPMIITYGVVASSMGVNISWTFYIFAVLGSFLLPILPLLAASIISIPLMYVVSFLKKRAIGNSIVIGVITLGILALYFVFIGSVSGMQQNVDEQGIVILSETMIKMLVSLKKYTIFNYNMVNALIGQKAFLNFLLYVVGLAVVFLLAVFVSAGFYNKGMRVIIEGSGTAIKKKNGKISYTNASFTKTFFKKEVKNLINTPQLFINTFLGIVVIPIFAIVFGKSMSVGEISTSSSDLGMIGMVMYMASIMMASGNMIAIVGFSMEGKNLYILKTLPITAKDIIKPKLLVSNLVGFMMALSTAISIFASSSSHNIIVALLVLVLLMLGSIGTTCLGLYNDLKAPNLHFKNVTELTKNNKRIIKPMLTSVLIGIVYMIMGIIFMSISDETFAAIYKYIVFFGVVFLINGLFAFLNWKALTDKAEERYERIEV